MLVKCWRRSVVRVTFAGRTSLEKGYDNMTDFSGLMDGFGYAFRASALAVGGIAAAVLALAGAGVLMGTFLHSKNANAYKGFLAKLYAFLNFETMIVELLLRYTYLAATGFVLLMSLLSLFTGDVGGFFGFLFGAVGVRIGYELLLLALVLVRNVGEINKKLKNQNESQSL
jgi:hypothetical protein